MGKIYSNNKHALRQSGHAHILVYVFLFILAWIAFFTFRSYIADAKSEREQEEQRAHPNQHHQKKQAGQGYQEY